MRTGYFLRVAIAFDAFLQAISNKGTIGVTISSRCGTGVAHGHRWAIWLSWFLDHTPWLGFGPNHCRDAIFNDILRNREAILELTDPVVVKYYADKS